MKSAEDVTSYTYLPTLALIPETKTGHTFVRRLLYGRAKITAPSLTDLRSPSAEAYRQLRTSLLFNSTGQTLKTIPVTSANPLDGKTTTAINVAVTFAQAGADVLLVDCDLRRPRVHSQLNLPNGKGFTDSLGEEDLDKILRSYGDLKVITAGSLPANPADLLGLPETGRLLGDLKERFSYIIIDSPPALAFADAAILSTLVDGVIIVAHAERTSLPVVRRVKERLLEVGATIYGVVLNCSNPKADNYYSGYYSSYYAEENEN